MTRVKDSSCYLRNVRTCDVPRIVKIMFGRCVAVLVGDGKCKKGLPDDGSRGVPKHEGGYFVHLLCVYSSARKVGFVSSLLHCARCTQAVPLHTGNAVLTSTYCTLRIYMYVGCSESKERLCIQPAQFFHCTRSVIWCVQ